MEEYGGIPVDTGNIIAVLERAGLTAVPPAAGRPDGAEVLRGFIRSALLAGETYRALAGALEPSPSAAVLGELAREEGETLRGLQTEYLLLTGDTCACQAKKPALRGALGTLVASRAAEAENAGRYLDAAGDFPELEELFSRLSRREERHAAILRKLIEGAMDN